MEQDVHNNNIIINFLESLKKLPDFKKINIIDILKKSSTKRYEYFNKLCLDGINLSYGDKLVLLRENLIYEKENDNYVVTLKALILIEYDSMDTFLNDLNKQFLLELYNKNAQKLSWDEKTIILTLLGLIACDKNSSFKFETTKNADIFQACAEDALVFLQENNIVDRQYTRDKLFNSNARGEHKVQAKMARINNIGIKTNNIYCKDTKFGHYLDIIINDDVNINNLYSILKLIFPTLPNKQKLKKLLNKMYNRRYEVLRDDSNISLPLKQKLEDAITMWTIN